MSHPVRIVTNGRILGSPLSGVQRYATELLSHFHQPLDIITPQGALARGWRGHLWEQLVLPAQLRGRLLWSPSNTGPIAVRHQVVTVHDTLPLDHPTWVASRYGNWYRRIVPRVARRARTVIVNSSFTRDRLLTWTDADPSNVHIVPLGVNARFSPATPDEIARSRRLLRIPEGDYVLALGTFDRRRNLSTVLRAWRNSGSTRGDVTLVLAGQFGDPWIFGDTALPDLPRGVVIVGRVDDRLLPALYSGASVFVMMSEYEGFGLPVLEAMSCGTPVIAARAGALPDTTGDAGILLDVNDDVSLAREITQLLDDPVHRRRWSAVGRARAEGLRWDVCAARTMTILESAATAGD
jgi:glycosyltransferase involved in cell wall biosynthesis